MPTKQKSISKNRAKKIVKRKSTKQPARKAAKKVANARFTVRLAERSPEPGRTVSVTSATKIIDLLGIEDSIVSAAKRAVH